MNVPIHLLLQRCGPDPIQERGPAWAHEQLAAQEAAYQAEAHIRKQQSEANVPKWIAARKALGQGK